MGKVLRNCRVLGAGSGVLAAVFFMGPTLAMAQDTPAQMVAVDPIRCWWRTSSGAVRIGETFTLVLTCAVLEADGVQVIPDESQLADSSIQLNPFEVVGGSHPPDLRSGQRRFFQYDYQVRVINPDVIGRDVPLPNLIIHYRVNSRLPGNAAMQGRDLSYLLPAHSVRVLSLVPADASDIRDTAGASFARVESLGARAGIFEIAAITLVALGSLMVIVSLITLLRGVRKRKAVSEKALAPWRIAWAADRELAAVAGDAAAQGWTPPVIARALAATRLAAAALLGRVVGQSPASAGTDADSQVILGGGLLGRLTGRRQAMVLSSPVTALDLRRELARLPEDAKGSRRQQIEVLADALTTFTSAQYGSGKERDRAALDGALAGAAEVARRLRTQLIWTRRRKTADAGASLAVERQA
jgi:hypothetical protein